MARTPRKWQGARNPSGLKRVRQAERRHAILQPRRSAAKTLVAKAVTVATIQTDGDDIAVALTDAISALDRAAKTGAIHPNAAARRKSRLVRKVNAAVGGTTVVSGGHVAKTTGKAAAAKAAKARIAAGKAVKAKGAQTAAGKARAALSRTTRAEGAHGTTAAATAARQPRLPPRPSPRRRRRRQGDDRQGRARPSPPPRRRPPSRPPPRPRRRRRRRRPRPTRRPRRRPARRRPSSPRAPRAPTPRSPTGAFRFPAVARA